MKNVTINDIKRAVSDLGIREGDIVLVHSSLKSLGYVEGGADTVIDGFLDVIGESGTLVFPTLCQRDWDNVYKNWHLDAPSDVGYITNVFRKRSNALRSNQATHSVAAIGKKAKYITETHGESGKRIGIFGDTPFSADSPWEKMYMLGTKVVFLGVGVISCTFRHYAEYIFIDKCLRDIQDHPDYNKMKEQLWLYGKKCGVWPHICNDTIYDYLKKAGKVNTTVCGNTTLICVNAVDFVDCALKALEEVNRDCFWDIPEAWDINETIKWIERINEIRNRKI